jgi:type III restriction enzyme
VLCALAVNRNMAAMTQLVGRILRQPDAVPTGVEALDQSYVVCHHGTTRDVVEAIKKSLEEEGMGDLARAVISADGTGGPKMSRRIPRRPAFQHLDVFLPVVNWSEGDTIRALDYERDILFAVKWADLDVAPLIARLPGPTVKPQRTQLTQIRFSEEGADHFLTATNTASASDYITFDPVYACRVVGDIVRNPWVARRIVADFESKLRISGYDDAALASVSTFLIEELRRFLLEESDHLAEAVFCDLIGEGRIQFSLRADGNNWRLPSSLATAHDAAARQLIRSDGLPVQRSIFSPVFDADFNTPEAEFACYLDEHGAIQWWHRNVARAGHYGLQGWRRQRVYPDFIFAVESSGTKRRILVIETKGDQLAGNLDTEYKRKLLNVVTNHYTADTMTRAGELQLVIDPNTSIICDLVLMSEWKTTLPREYLSADSPDLD